MLTALEAVLPDTWRKFEQWPVQPMAPGKRERKLYMEVTVIKVDVEGAFVIEVNWEQHYNEDTSNHFEQGSHPTQLKQDRYSESYCLSRGSSVFHVPESFKRSSAKIDWAVEYIKTHVWTSVQAYCVSTSWTPLGLPAAYRAWR